MKKLLFLFAFVSAALYSEAQTWVDLMTDDDVNFYEVQEAFEEEWGDQGYIRGRGYKQYKRWEYFMEPRVYPSGERVSGLKLMEALKVTKKMGGMEMKSDNPWTPVGPTSWTGFGWNPGLGRVNATYVDPTNSEHIYVATPAGGLWESTDNGDTWASLTDTLVAIGASAIAVNPENTNIIYLATGDGNASDTYSFGVIKSIDGGNSWEPTNLDFEIENQIRCTDLLMDPQNPDKIYVTSSQGLFVTEDGGETWDQPLSIFLRDVAIHPGNSDIVYAAGTRFYKSEDGGESFDQINSGLPSSGQVNRLEMAVTAANDQLVYILAGDSDDSGFQGFYRSTDEGDSFELMSNSPNILGYSQTGDSQGGQSWYDLAIAASPTDEDRVFVGGINVWETTNGGSSWNIKSHWYYPPNIAYTHADIHSLDFFGNTLYCGSDGGVFRSNDNGNAWEDISEGLQISQFYRISVSVSDPDKILAGAQDNGTNLFSSENGYEHILGGDGNGAAIDYTNDDVMYASYPGGAYQRSTNGGLSFQDYTNGINETGAWVTPFEIHPTNPNILFAGYENVWKNEDGEWSVISNLNAGTTLRAMRVAPSNPDVIMASTFQLLYRTENGGETWDEIGNGLPNLFITSIEIDPQDSDRIWVGFSGYNEGQKVFYSDNGGDNWENISGNLPNIPVNCLHYLQGSNDAIYAGTDAGVFYIDNDLENWSPYNEGLPNVIVNQLVFHYPTQQIFLASYGRGVWKNGFFNTDDLAPIPNFTANNTAVCPGGEVTFNNLSLNATSGVEWTFEGGQPESSTESSPVVTYAESGFYTVKIKAINGEVADSLIITNCIQVLNNENAPYTEDFEEQTEDLVDWIVSEPEQNITWEFNPAVGFLSENSVFVENYNLIGNGQVELTSQVIDLSQLDTAFISMRAAFARKSDSGYEALRVFINTDCSDEWTFKKVFPASSSLPSVEPTDVYFTPENEDEWNYLVVTNIQPEERTENFRFRFIFYNNGGNNIFLDDINLSESNVLSTYDQSEFTGEVKLYPNPTTDNVNIALTLTNAETILLHLMGADGKLLFQDGPHEMSQGTQNINLSLGGMPPGSYILEVVGESGVSHHKIILAKQ